MKHRSAPTETARRSHSWAARLSHVFGRQIPDRREATRCRAEGLPVAAEDDLLRRLREAGL